MGGLTGWVMGVRSSVGRRSSVWKWWKQGAGDTTKLDNWPLTPLQSPLKSKSLLGPPYKEIVKPLPDLTTVVDGFPIISATTSWRCFFLCANFSRRLLCLFFRAWMSLQASDIPAIWKIKAHTLLTYVNNNNLEIYNVKYLFSFWMFTWGRSFSNNRTRPDLSCHEDRSFGPNRSGGLARGQVEEKERLKSLLLTGYFIHQQKS